MEDVQFTAAEFTDKRILTATGDLVGTVAGVDEAANELLVAPNPVYVDEAAGARRGDDTAVSFDANWLANAEMEVQELPEDAYAHDAEEWPFTLSPADVDSVDGDEIQLRL